MLALYCGKTLLGKKNKGVDQNKKKTLGWVHVENSSYNGCVDKKEMRLMT
jgi:hypothetical protein